MLLSKLTPSAAKPLTRHEEVLPGALVSHRCVRWMGLLSVCLPHSQRWADVPRPGLTAWYVHREM
jgi:hypothetical protein